MSVLHVQTLGEVRLVGESGEPVALRRKPLALLAYIARRAPRAVPRTELATLIWGDRAEDRARQSLRQALLELKQVVGDALVVDSDGVGLTDGAVTLDVAELERDAREGRPEAAVARWRGEFFPDAASVGGDVFERWVEGERVTLLRRLSTAMETLVGAAELRTDWSAAAQWAAAWADAAPFDERANARLIEALRMEGRAAAALEAHAEFVARVRERLDVEPSPEFARLAGGLQEQVRTEAARRGRPSTAVRTPALVGRGHELAELAGAWDGAMDGTSHIVLVDDEGGSGKTRLCDEMARIARASPDGAVVLRHCGAASEDGPYPGAAGLFAGLRDAPGTAGASPEALAEVARLVPSLGTLFRHLPAPSGDEEALRDALVQVLIAVSEETPVLVVLDDAHLVDPPSRVLVAAVAARITGRVAMLFVGDMGTRRPGGVLDTLFAIPGVLRIRLRPLAVHEVEAMVASMLNVAEADRAPLATRLHGEARGTPFLVYELVVAMVEERLLTLDPGGTWRASPTLEGRPLPLPTSVRERVGRGLAPLSPTARTLLDTAAVLGTPIDGVLLEAVAGLTPDESGVALRELTMRRILREDAHTGRLDFTHPILGRVAYAMLSPSERQAWHARAAEEMAARDMTRTAERSVLPFHLARAAMRTTAATPVAGAAVVTGPSPPAARRRRMIAARVGLGAVAIVVALGAMRVARSRTTPAGAVGAEPHRVVVGAFENRSGSAELERVRDIATNWIVRGLAETGLVEVVGVQPGPDGAVGAAARLTTDRELREAARAARAGTIVTGALYQVGDSIELEAMIVDATNGSLRRALPPVRALAADPLGGVDRLRRQVVGAVAAMTDPAYAAADAGAQSPPSYEAYLAFMRGEEAYLAVAFTRAAQEYRRAAAADSTYALPVLRLAYTSYQDQRCDRVDSIGAVLDHRRAQLSRFEGYYLDRVTAWCRADWVAAHLAARRMADLPPRTAFAQFAAATSAISANFPREALHRLDAIDLSRGWVPAGGRYWFVRTVALHMAGDQPGLRVVAERLKTMPRDVYAVAGAVYAAAALGEAEEFGALASEFVARALTSDAGSLLLLAPTLDELRAHGRGADARALGVRLAALVGAAAPPGPAGDTLRYTQAELLYRADRWKEAEALVAPLLLRHGDNVLVVALHGRLAARLGDRAGALRARAALPRLANRALPGADLYGQAQITALLGDRAEAVRLLQRAAAGGTPFMFDASTAYLGHADPDLESIVDDPAVQALLRRRG